MVRLQAIFAALVVMVTPVHAQPLVIGHRGASGDRPEHTLESYRTAIAQGADFIEPDLVPTKDGVLVARHENEISGTTDVAARPEFAMRRATKVIDGQSVTGWFTEDFTLAELKTLRARERLPQLRSTAFDGQFDVPTLEEVIALVKTEETRTGRRIGLYPETKHPSYFAGLGLPLEDRLVGALAGAGYTRKSDPVFIQSFEVGNLKTLHGKTRLRLVQLMGGATDLPPGGGLSYGEMMTPAGLKAVAAYASGIGPEKAAIIPRDAKGRLGTPTALVADAHKAGLTVHPYTFRAENYFLPAEFRTSADPRAAGNLSGEICAFLKTGIDGLFSDNPGVAVTARDACRN